MKFDEAVYRKDGIEKIIPLEEIIRQKDYEDTINNLFCPHAGCFAKLQYNKKSNGNDYLSKKIGYSHGEDCPVDDANILVRTISFIQEENGRLSNEGIDRRKDDAMNVLENFFSPPEPKEKKPYKPRQNKKEADESEQDATIEVKQGRRIKYDPTADIVKNDSDADVKTYEPPFYQRLLHQITNKDQGKDLKTSAKIERMVIHEEQQRAQIYGSFEKVDVVFEITPTFFVNSRRSLVASELIGYLKGLKRYIESTDKDLYITTLCQSHKFDPSELVLFIYEPDFMGFQFIKGRRFKSLTDVFIAIETGII